MRDGRQVIAILCGGGLTHAAGGIGQLSSYLLDEWARSASETAIRREVIDTRGRGGRAAGVAVFARALVRLSALAATGRLALLHANMSTRGSAWRKCALCRMAQAARVPTVMHLHGADFTEYRAALPRPYRALLDATLRRATRVVVLGRRWRDLLVEEAGVAASRVEVVPNGVPEPASAPSGAGGAGVAEIVMLGRLGARKGVPDLLAALAGAALRDRPWRATLAGDGDVDGFRLAADRLGLAGRVSLPGWLDRQDTSALLARATIFVLPSHHEAMPLAVIEALAHGVAVITTPVGANPDYLTHEGNALLVPPGDALALADAIGRLLDDPELRQRIARAGRQTFEATLSIGIAAERLAAIHREAIARPGAPPWTRQGGSRPSDPRNKEAAFPEGF